jgi:DNA repair photolyase
MEKNNHTQGKCRVEELFCRTALSPSLLQGIDYSLNPYYGCQHGCKYCYVPNVFKINRQDWGIFVKPKKNIPKILSKELKNKKKGIVGISTVTDPYQPLEKKYRLTRYCLEQLYRYDWPINILTKSSLIQRDIQIIQKFSKSTVGMTISSLKQEELDYLEPFTSPVKERLEALSKFSKNGIYTYIFMGPLYPSLNYEDLPQVLETYFSTGIRELVVDKIHLKPGVWPNMREQLTGKTREIFKKRLFDTQYYPKIFTKIEELCLKNNVLYQRSFSH